VLPVGARRGGPPHDGESTAVWFEA
jgi:hypothetical protein